MNHIRWFWTHQYSNEMGPKAGLKEFGPRDQWNQELGPEDHGNQELVPGHITDNSRRGTTGIGVQDVPKMDGFGNFGKMAPGSRHFGNWFRKNLFFYEFLAIDDHHQCVLRRENPFFVCVLASS